MHAGPKPAVDPSELPWRPVRGPESESFADFCTRFLRLGGGKPLILRDWQRDLVASVWDEGAPSTFGCLGAGAGGREDDSGCGDGLLRLHDWQQRHFSRHCRG